MKVYDLPIGSVVLAPAWMHPLLRHACTKAKTGSIGIKLYPLTGYLTSFATTASPNKQDILFSYYKTIQEILPDLSIYQSTATTLPFLEACLAFIQDMKLCQITCDQLPTKSPSQVERQKVISALYAIPCEIDIQLEGLSNIKDASNVYIYPTYTSINASLLVHKLIKKGAKQWPFEQQLEDKHFFHAVNKRQEIEACAQYIIRQKLHAEDIHITLADRSVQPLLKQIFQRYQIPYTLLQESHASIMSKRCLALFNYYLEPNREKLLLCLDHGLFQFEHGHALQTYMDMFACDIHTPFTHLRSIQEKGHILTDYDLAKLQEMEAKAAICQPFLQDAIQNIETPESYERLFLAIMDALATSTHRPQEQRVLRNIGEVLTTIFPYIQNDEDLRFALPFIETIQESESITKVRGCIITSLTQYAPDRAYHFMLGCTQKQYPAFPVKAGIFDEVYYREIAYPSMDCRYQLHQEQLASLRDVSKHVFVSYPLGTYEGKALEAALEIEQWMKQPSTRYPLTQRYIPFQMQSPLSSQEAKHLFLKDGKLLSSISAMERYVKCPFSYFLRYGLGLREPMNLGFSDSYMGTLSHYILEQLVSTYGKSYTEVAEEKIHALLCQEIQAMSNVFINRKAQLKSMQARIHCSIIQTLQRLHAFEEHNHLRPWKQEASFYYDIPLTEDTTMVLHGYIDRIDVDGNIACILDYKSSAKLLSETNVFAALQLQLITYAIVTKRLFHKTMIGAYYISLKNQNVAQKAGTISRRKPVTYIVHGKEEYLDSWYKEHRLTGWTMHPQVAELDDTGTHIVGIRENKDGMITASKMYNLSAIERWFMQMYQSIGEKILQGNIACEPSEDACMFCAYHEICQFKGYYMKKPLLVEVNEDLFWKGEIEDAGME